MHAYPTLGPKFQINIILRNPNYISTRKIRFPIENLNQKKKQTIGLGRPAQAESHYCDASQGRSNVHAASPQGSWLIHSWRASFIPTKPTKKKVSSGCIPLYCWYSAAHAHLSLLRRSTQQGYSLLFFFCFSSNVVLVFFFFLVHSLFQRCCCSS